MRCTFKVVTTVLFASADQEMFLSDLAQIPCHLINIVLLNTRIVLKESTFPFVIVFQFTSYNYVSPHLHSIF